MGPNYQASEAPKLLLYQDEWAGMESIVRVAGGYSSSAGATVPLQASVRNSSIAAGHALEQIGCGVHLTVLLARATATQPSAH